MIWLALGLGLFFAVNIGASGTAAAMGAAYGSGAVRRKAALILVALCALGGAVLAGSEVSTTIGKGLLGGTEVSAAVAAVILASASLSLFAANLAGVPLSTSEVTVGAVMGAALFLGPPAPHKIGLILLTWTILPLLSALIAYLLQRFLAGRLRPLLRGRRRYVALLLTLGGCYEALAAGSNNVANAVGPLIGAGLVPIGAGVMVGGLGLALGALTLGGRVLNTNAKKITALDLISGSFVSFVGATLVLVASLLGFPVPLTQVTTMGIVGVGYANGGWPALNPATLKRVAQVWIVSPLVSLIAAYAGTVAISSATPAVTAWVLLPAAGVVLLALRLLRPGQRMSIPRALPTASPAREAAGKSAL